MRAGTADILPLPAGFSTVGSGGGCILLWRWLHFRDAVQILLMKLSRARHYRNLKKLHEASCSLPIHLLLCIALQTAILSPRVLAAIINSRNTPVPFAFLCKETVKRSGSLQAQNIRNPVSSQNRMLQLYSMAQALIVLFLLMLPT